jgi:ribosomal protein S5
MGITHFSSVLSTFPVYKKATSVDVTLSDQEAADACILEITPGASKSIIFPKAIEGKVVFVTNLASATHTITIKVGADGTGVAVGAAKSAILRCNGTDFVRVTADA